MPSFLCFDNHAKHILRDARIYTSKERERDEREKEKCINDMEGDLACLTYIVSMVTKKYRIG